MKLLSREALERARSFIYAHVRPLERARLAYHFIQVGAEAVLSALVQFQNPDGDFGNALEPDLCTPSSSALATGIGLEIPKRIDCSVNQELVQRSEDFLLNTFNPGENTWRVAPLDANDFPHATWWHDENGSLAKTFDDFLIIPRAQIVALLWHCASLVPGEWLDFLIDKQSPDGSWDPVWTWNGLYPKVWEIPRLEWRGVLTYDALVILQGFGRIENP